MLKTYNNILSEEDIVFILNIPEVKKAKEDIDRKANGAVYFSAELLPKMREKIFETFGLSLTNVPMRWIKGDTKPHIDQGENTFDNTHLLYLTDSQGEFLIDNISYPIQKNTGYIFSEGLSHETINTGSTPRLLLGPMSEQGFAVGGSTTIIADGATETIYFKYETGSGIFYKINNGSYIGPSLPITIINSNTSATLKVLFETDITISSNILYFVCGSANIQFGSTSLNTDGSRPVFTIDGVSNYLGLIQNGTSTAFSSYFNIYVYNIEVNTINSSTLVANGGWIGQEYFAGKGHVQECYIVNCSSNGLISNASGGIVGGSAGADQGRLTIISCSSSGAIGTNSGGIVGRYAGRNSGNVSCEMCWSTGVIGSSAGGIFGHRACDTGDLSDPYSIVTAINCYSTGLINLNGGGIFGEYAGINFGRANAINCYSQGTINTSAGGIFGSNAGYSDGITEAQNCYSSGSIATLGNGIYGTYSLSDNTVVNCYSANGTWNTTTANSNLTGAPTSPNVIGTTWVATTINQPYELLNMGYTPYTLDNISVSIFYGVPSLIRTLSQSVNSNSSTEAAIVSGKSYTKLEISGGNSASYSTITINPTSGIISTTSSTTPGTYTIYIRNNGSYNITTFILTVTSTPTPIVQRDNSFTVYDLFLDDVQNSIYLAQTGTYGSYNNSFTIYDIAVLELTNQALLDE
jgi:hypothetical protein